jgi:hypothetical protein
VTLANDDGSSNGGAEALRVACRFWPADIKRRVELDAAIREVKASRAFARGKASGAKRPGPKPTRSWTCPECDTRNQDRSWCRKCRAFRITNEEAPRHR